jgi:hypothetical protein
MGSIREDDVYNDNGMSFSTFMRTGGLFTRGMAAVGGNERRRSVMVGSAGFARPRRTRTKTSRDRSVAEEKESGHLVPSETWEIIRKQITTKNVLPSAQRFESPSSFAQAPSQQDKLHGTFSLPPLEFLNEGKEGKVWKYKWRGRTRGDSTKTEEHSALVTLKQISFGAMRKNGRWSKSHDPEDPMAAPYLEVRAMIATNHLLCYCPNFVQIFDWFKCTGAQISASKKKEGPSALDTGGKKSSIANDVLQYMVCEFCDHHDLFKFITENQGFLQDETCMRSCLFQIIFAIFLMQHFFGMTHYDLHDMNVLVSSLDKKEIDYIEYSVGGIHWFVPNVGVVFKLYDYAFSFSDVLNLSRKGLDDKGAKDGYYAGGIENRFKDFYDMATIATYIMFIVGDMKSETGKNVPKSVEHFLVHEMMDGYEFHKKKNEDRPGPHMALATSPIQALSSDFFSPFLSPPPPKKRIMRFEMVT